MIYEADTEDVLLTIEGEIAQVILNRPTQGNALNLSTSRQLAKVFRHIRSVQSTLRGVVLRGAGPRFCVGGDLNGFLQSGLDDRLCDVLARPLHEAVDTMAELEIPIVSVVHGAVGGGGLGIMLASDLILAADDTVFRCGYTGSGLSPDCGVTWHLPRVIGMARAMDLVLTNRRLTAVDAERLGLVSRIAPAAELDQLAQELLVQLILLPRTTIAETKRLMWDGWATHRHAHLHEEAGTIGRVGDLPDSREAMTAFLTKRPPQYAKRGESPVNPKSL